MTRRPVALVGLLAGIASGLGGSSPAAQSPGAQSPDAQDSAAPSNVLVVLCDQLGAGFLGCAGDAQAQTPNLDRLARSGARFTHAVAATPRCGPCRAGIQTGLHIHANGVSHNDDRLSAAVPTFAEIFAADGYATGYAGKWDLDGAFDGGVGGWIPPERRRGWQEWHGYEKGHEFFEVADFDESVDPPARVAVPGYDWEPTWHTDLALDFVRRHAEARRPWLYFVSYGPPHAPDQCPPQFLERFDADELVLPPDLEGVTGEEERELRRLMHVYYAQVTAVDHEVGRLLDGLDELGVAEDTLVLFTSDHGDCLGSHRAAARGIRGKGVPFRKAFHVPLLVRQPGRVRAGGVYDALASTIDVAPTLLELAQPDVPASMRAARASMQGVSLASWCTTGAGPRREAVYLLLDGSRRVQWRAAWDGRFLLSTLAYRHLYDHASDPHERTDRLADPEFAEHRRRMEAHLLRLAEQVRDPELATIRAALGR